MGGISREVPSTGAGGMPIYLNAPDGVDAVLALGKGWATVSKLLSLAAGCRAVGAFKILEETYCALPWL
jgi:hypothetical protein